MFQYDASLAWKCLFTPLSGRVNEKKGQDRKKVTRGLYFTYLWRSPHWSDVHEKKFSGWCSQRNHVCQVSKRNFQGYDFTGGRIFHFSIDFWMGLTTVQRYCAACDRPSWPTWIIPKRNGCRFTCFCTPYPCANITDILPIVAVNLFVRPWAHQIHASFGKHESSTYVSNRQANPSNVYSRKTFDLNGLTINTSRITMMCECYFYPRGASDARVIAIIVCPSVCLCVTRQYCMNRVNVGSRKQRRDSPASLVLTPKFVGGRPPFLLKFALKVTHTLSNSTISTTIGS